MRRFGDAAPFAPGEKLFTAGKVGPGLIVILSGNVDSDPDDPSRRPHADRHARPGCSSWANWRSSPAGLRWSMPTRRTGRGLIIPPDRLRALLIAEAELGERIMRALILRRMGLLERGAGGPVIVGRAENGDVFRLEGFLRRNGSSASIAQSRNRSARPKR